MNLSTTYLGLQLASPIVAGASPLVHTAADARLLEEAGAAAIVLHSLFEEEILRAVQDQLAVEAHEESFAEATSYLPDLQAHLGPEPYLELLRSVKDAVGIPVIASLNGSTPGGWTRYAAQLQQAGADAIELNIYSVPTDIEETGSSVEERTVETVREVAEAVDIPVAVKLSPFYSSFGHLASRLVQAGAKGLVLFNRFYEPDLDVEELATVPSLELSTSSELRLRLRWLALLHGRVPCSLAATGGVHTSVDIVKAVMAGADAVQMVSELLANGPGAIGRLLDGVRFWMEEHEYGSLAEMRGAMSALKNPEPAALARANYMKVLDSYRG